MRAGMRACVRVRVCAVLDERQGVGCVCLGNPHTTRAQTYINGTEAQEAELLAYTPDPTNDLFVVAAPRSGLHASAPLMLHMTNRCTHHAIVATRTDTRVSTFSRISSPMIFRCNQESRLSRKSANGADLLAAFLSRADIGK